jgi:hypothetical protein
MLYLDFNYLFKKQMPGERPKSTEQVMVSGIDEEQSQKPSALRNYQNFLRDFLKKAKVQAKSSEFDIKSDKKQ